jgi:hypothetical protein
MSITKAQAIRAIDPDSRFSIRGGVINWETSSISDADIDTKQTELQTAYDAQEYARNRKAEYPSIEECVHAILDDQLDALQDKRRAVKDRYPK